MNATEKKWQAHIEHLAKLIGQCEAHNPRKALRLRKAMKQQKAALAHYTKHIKGE